MPPAIRWERLSRYGLLAVLAVLALLYISPLKSYVSTHREAGRRAAQVTALEKTNKRLHNEVKALSDNSVLATKARAMGMVVPGELPYVVKGLPKN